MNANGFRISVHAQARRIERAMTIFEKMTKAREGKYD